MVSMVECDEAGRLLGPGCGDISPVLFNVVLVQDEGIVCSFSILSSWSVQLSVDDIDSVGDAGTACFL